MAAKHEESAALLPSRQVTVCQAFMGNCMASSFTTSGLWPGARRNNFGGLPRPLHGLGGSGAVPGAHTEVPGRIPTTYNNPNSVMGQRLTGVTLISVQFAG
ncbi:hypothetical protein B0G73_14034 [Paraburkholderia sp. BL25I1N1]|nr:hypothetical protein B0G73_14034 [Paraburkholderia sp. BL25I1N1]